MTRRNVILSAFIVAALAFIGWRLHTSQFHWGAFWQGLRRVSLPTLILAVLANNSNALFRAVRWSIFLKPAGRRVPWWTLVGPQFVGFAGLAALGRVGELIRPYLVSRRTGLSFSSQIAVVAVERIFDLGAFGIIFTAILATSPQLNTLPYHERYRYFGYAIAGAIAFLFAFVLGMRLAGEALANRMESVSPLRSFAGKIRAFRSGLDVIGSTGDFCSILILSVLTWSMVVLGYMLTLKAFPAPVHDLDLSRAVLLMGFSVAGGLVQLPGIGGGPQIMTALALTRLYDIPAEIAASASLLLWVVSTESALLPGLLFARSEHISLRSMARASRQPSTPHPVH